MNNFLTVRDLTEMGFGNRVTIWKKVRNKEFPPPIKFGNSINSPNRWEKDSIDDYLRNLKVRANAKGGVQYEA
ncbi:transcriptional regulator [Gammaproteobacteria bacterium]|nr:transcriptional regulator [Gammaproteobacteria bacterium]